ncbi:hypothetical protein EJ357_15065 [Streptomyces cyaneochromogenes]|uniref:Uncharacterized protein n=1 Tax=Streptomyces cyaneochromogenes TaxID=2496836 RepID=A0A3S9M5Z2_9ACTN|nr:hypothetical protein [Streptomyces cyaneochromogenes]AZQ34636.1 hypothetical protein EJ357_15065 [Streptomyces cyaneochromogenes]
MSDEEQRQDAPGEQGFEERLRELLAEDAYTIRPSPAPYPAIRRQGVVERRRRVAAAGAALVTLAAMPVGAYALGGGGNGGGTATDPRPSASATRAPSPTPSATESRPERPGTARQLFDGITFEQAADGLENCLAYDAGGVRPSGDPGRGTADEYRILLAMRSTGDSNAVGDGMFVVAVREKDPERISLMCRVIDGETQGISGFGDDTGLIEDEGPVYVNPNAGKLYQQSIIDRGNWKLPFRWGVVGIVKPSVAEVTVSYGGSSGEAALDDGFFVASGELNRQVTEAPHIKGYDADGKLVYDSDGDKYYQRTLP